MGTIKTIAFIGISIIFLIILWQWAVGLLPLEGYAEILPLFPFLIFLFYEVYFRDESKPVGWVIRILITVMIALLIIGYGDDFSFILSFFQK